MRTGNLEFICRITKVDIQRIDGIVSHTRANAGSVDCGRSQLSVVIANRVACVVNIQNVSTTVTVNDKRTNNVFKMTVTTC